MKRLLLLLLPVVGCLMGCGGNVDSLEPSGDFLTDEDSVKIYTEISKYMEQVAERYNDSLIKNIDSAKKPDVWANFSPPIWDSATSIQRGIYLQEQRRLYDDSSKYFSWKAEAINNRIADEHYKQLRAKVKP